MCGPEKGRLLFLHINFHEGDDRNQIVVFLFDNFFQQSSQLSHFFYKNPLVGLLSFDSIFVLKLPQPLQIRGWWSGRLQFRIKCMLLDRRLLLNRWLLLYLCCWTAGCLNTCSSGGTDGVGLLWSAPDQKMHERAIQIHF